MDLYDRAHLRFYFRHCSSNEAKDKHSIFAFAFVPLMETDGDAGVTIKVCIFSMELFPH